MIGGLWNLPFAADGLLGSPKGCVKKLSVVRALPVTISMAVVFLENNFLAFSSSVLLGAVLTAHLCLFHLAQEAQKLSLLVWGLWGPATDVLTKHPVQQMCATAGAALWAGSLLVFLFFGSSGPASQTQVSAASCFRVISLWCWTSEHEVNCCCGKQGTSGLYPAQEGGGQWGNRC